MLLPMQLGEPTDWLPANGFRPMTAVDLPWSCWWQGPVAPARVVALIPRPVTSPAAMLGDQQAIVTRLRQTLFGDRRDGFLLPRLGRNIGNRLLPRRRWRRQWHLVPLWCPPELPDWTTAVIAGGISDHPQHGVLPASCSPDGDLHWPDPPAPAYACGRIVAWLQQLRPPPEDEQTASARSSTSTS